MSSVRISLLVFTSICISMCSPPLVLPNITVKEIAVPCEHGAQSRVHVGPTGQAYLSWVEHLDTSSFSFRYSRLKDDIWQPPTEIASGENWFVNWADFPSLVEMKDGGLATHRLEMRGEGTYDYDIHISTTEDGDSWSSSFVPHRDSLSAEHGFVSMATKSDDEAIAVWLDGRNMAGHGHEEAGHNEGDEHGTGQRAMTLRTAAFDRSGRLSDETELDARVCECCQTDLARTTDGWIAVYRDRSEDEVRDIHYVRKVNDVWTQPKAIHADGWQIHGCPVNGPAVAAIENQVAVAWFTAANDTAKVQLVLSDDGGAYFGSPILLDDNKPIGRVDVAWRDQTTALVSWIGKTGDEASVRARWVTVDGVTSPVMELTPIHPGRSSGFPILARDQESMLMSWTHYDGDQTRVKSARLMY